RPNPIGNVLYQRDLRRGPDAWLSAVKPERPDELTVLDEQWTEVRSDTRGLQRLTLGRRRSLGRTVVRNQRAPSQNVIMASPDELGPAKLADHCGHDVSEIA